MCSARIWQVFYSISHPEGLKPFSLSRKSTKFNFRQLEEREPQTFVLAVFIFNVMHIFMHSRHLHEMHKYGCKDLLSAASYLYQEKVEKLLGHCVKKQQGQNYLFLQHTQADSSNSPRKHFPRQAHAILLQPIDLMSHPFLSFSFYVQSLKGYDWNTHCKHRCLSSKSI